MKPFLLVLALAATAPLHLAHAEMYQWKDSNGRTVISDTPPPGTVRQAKKTDTSSPSSKPSEEAKAPEAPKSLAEREMDFKKRQQENKEKADKAAKESTANAEKAENCQRARAQLASLESGQRIAMTDTNGERRFMEDDERQRELERTRKFVADACK